MERIVLDEPTVVLFATRAISGIALGEKGELMSTTPAGKPRRASRSDIVSFNANNRSPSPFGPRRRESRDSFNSELEGWHFSRANTPDPDRIFGRRSPDSSDIQIVIDPVQEPPALSALSVDAEPTPYHTPREAFQNVEGAEPAGGPTTPPKRRMPYIDNMDENIWTESNVPYRLEPLPSDWGPYTASEEWGTINKPSAPAARMVSFNQKSALRNVNPALSTLGALIRPSGQIKVNKVMDSLAHPTIQASNERKHAKHIPKTVLEPELSSVAHSIGTSSGIPEDSTIWTDYVNEAEQQDHEQIANWNQMMDVLLVFAALFSAILTAFIIEVYKVLKPDPQDLTVDLLRNISISLQASLQNSLPSESVLSPQFIPSSGYMWVNGLCNGYNSIL
ncbi:hypothetical protein Hypma_003039 [Hypsizygus marmoreus]|uniref:DUF6535 domain-containing protein n=1 Tax=Hypsizygus marmoreus TaxID=39966 RepID=A0A369J571_HYPMA|nr:hypothetical protein Hypma_003039 [Hypsizygus marmoreus]